MIKVLAGLALVAFAPASEPSPEPPPLPISHHDRPATPAIGTYYVGRLSEACGGGRLPDGRAYRDQPHRFENGDRLGISLTSPDAPLTLQVLRAGAPDSSLATLEARGDGERAAAMIEVGDARDLVLRVIGGPDSADARWRVELSFDRPIDSVYFSDFFDWSRAEAACR